MNVIEIDEEIDTVSVDWSYIVQLINICNSIRWQL